MTNGPEIFKHGCILALGDESKKGVVHVRRNERLSNTFLQEYN